MFLACLRCLSQQRKQVKRNILVLAVHDRYPKQRSRSTLEYAASLRTRGLSSSSGHYRGFFGKLNNFDSEVRL